MMSKYKSELLGENFSTAAAKLRKAILFHLAQQLELDTCFRCNLTIDDIANFSIEHKEAWQSAPDPVKTFYDLENIAFSHTACNYGAAVKTNRKYKTRTEYRAANWSKYYAHKKEQILSRKRERYHKNQSIAQQ